MTERAVAHALAAELVALTGQLDALAYDLARDPAILRAHMASLQAVDRITQTQLAIAAMLSGEGPIADRLAAVPLEALQASIAERLGARV
jgi:hypothetical protein